MYFLHSCIFCFYPYFHFSPTSFATWRAKSHVLFCCACNFPIQELCKRKTEANKNCCFRVKFGVRDWRYGGIRHRKAYNLNDFGGFACVFLVYVVLKYLEWSKYDRLHTVKWKISRKKTGEKCFIRCAYTLAHIVQCKITFSHYKSYSFHIIRRGAHTYM